MPLFSGYGAVYGRVDGMDRIYRYLFLLGAGRLAHACGGLCCEHGRCVLACSFRMRCGNGGGLGVGVVALAGRGVLWLVGGVSAFMAFDSRAFAAIVVVEHDFLCFFVLRAGIRCATRKETIARYAGEQMRETKARGRRLVSEAQPF